MKLLHHNNIEEISQYIVEKSIVHNIKIATAESCTGGMISSTITNISGSSAIFELGVVVYANRFKSSILKVPESMIEKYGAVSHEVARAMAEGIINLSGASIGISVTGIAGPTGGSITKPIGTVYIGMATSKDIQVFHEVFIGSRQDIRNSTTYFALKAVQNLILKF